MNSRVRNFMQRLASVAAFFYMAHAQAAPINMSIVSDSTWRSSSSAPAGWADPAFDDSTWRHAYAPYPNSITTPADIAGQPSAAELMWDWNKEGQPNGRTGPNEAWFRYTFDLQLSSSSLPLLAQALIIADDEFEFFVNGKKYDFGQSTALSDHLRSNGQPDPLLADFSALLRNGKNVLAIHAADGSLAAPRDRFFEYVYFEGRIVTVPEPGSMALVLLGFLGMSIAAGQLRRRH